MNRLPVIVRQYLASFRILVVFTILCGVIYPGVVLGISQVAFHQQANGSLVTYKGQVVGSSLLCQEFVNPKTGAPLAQWFQPRPSNATSEPNTATGSTSVQNTGQLGSDGDWGCNGIESAASNLGPTNPEEVGAIAARQKQIEAFDHVSQSQIPPDAVTASGSGLDPDISPQNADIQVARVAAARHLPVSVVQGLVNKFTQGRTIGVLGEPRVDVLTLNIALAELPGQSAYNGSGS
jgi:potassium-transporting ATPase KdpC subunit